MGKITLNDITASVENHIGIFHQKHLLRLERLKLERILKGKNLYLFKARNILMAHDLVKSLLDAHLSSQEETIFGDLMEI